MIVESAVNGSKNAVATSGFKSISDLWIGCHASIDEPSKGIPLSNVDALTALIIYVTWCHVPFKSVNLKSTNLTSFSYNNQKTLQYY